MKAKCINNCINGDIVTCVTLGKVYDLKRIERDGTYAIEGDDGVELCFVPGEDFFELIPETDSVATPATSGKKPVEQKPVEILDPVKLSNQLETATTYIRKEAGNVVKSFCRIGYKLWEVREKKLYLGREYNNVAEYAEKVLGFKKSSTSNYIQICEKFSVCDKDGKPTAKLQSEYASYSYTQLALLLTMPEEKLADVTPDMSCQEIKALRSAESAPASCDDVTPGGDTAECSDKLSDTGKASRSSDKEKPPKVDSVFERVLTEENYATAVKALKDCIGFEVRITVRQYV